MSKVMVGCSFSRLGLHVDGDSNLTPHLRRELLNNLINYVGKLLLGQYIGSREVTPKKRFFVERGVCGVTGPPGPLANMATELAATCLVTMCAGDEGRRQEGDDGVDNGEAVCERGGLRDLR